MANVIRLVDKASDATVLFDFDLASGTGNPNSLKTYIHGDSFDLGHIPTDIVYFEPANAPGGSVARTRHGLTQRSFRFDGLATSPTNLFAAIGTLGKYLAQPSEYTLLLQLEGWGEKRYADIVSGEIPALLYGQARGMHHTLNLLRDPNGIEVVLMTQPYLRGPSVTVGPTTVQNDPADASGRFIEVTNAGNAAAPAAVKVQGDTGAKVQKVVVARKSVGPFASTRVTDYTGGTQYGQLNATGNGWTVALTTGTTSVADADASTAASAFAAQTTHATDPTVMNERIRIHRTANLDSLRGTFDVYARIKNTAAAKHVVQLRWAHSLADPPTFSEAEVIHDTTGHATFAYEDKKLGRISVPKEHMLGGLALEFWSRRDSGSGNLMWDFVSLVPADESLSTIVVPQGSTETWTGSQLLTPSEPAGLGAGVVNGTSLDFNANNEAGGTPPNTGLLWPAGRHIFRVYGYNNARTSASLTFRVRNITDDTYAVTKTFTPQYAFNQSIEFDVGAGTHATTDTYQVQIVDVSGGSDQPPKQISIWSIAHTFVPYIAATEEAHSDPSPDKQMLHKMDASDNIVLPLAVEGPLPIWLAPGLNALYLHYAEVPIESGAGNESKLTRDCAVTISYAPRYLQ